MKERWGGKDQHRRHRQAGNTGRGDGGGSAHVSQQFAFLVGLPRPLDGSDMQRPPP